MIVCKGRNRGDETRKGGGNPRAVLLSHTVVAETVMKHIPIRGKLRPILLYGTCFVTVATCLWWTRWLVREEDAKTFVAMLERGAPVFVANALHDGAVIRHHGSSGDWDESVEDYRARILASNRDVEGGTPYSYEQEILGIETDWLRGTAVVTLHCRTRYGNTTTTYWKLLTLSKRKGQVGIVKRESFVQKEEDLANLPVEATR